MGTHGSLLLAAPTHGLTPIRFTVAVYCIGIRCNPILSRDGQGSDVALKSLAGMVSCTYAKTRARVRKEIA